jgi:hypothetical protein
MALAATRFRAPSLPTCAIQIFCRKYDEKYDWPKQDYAKYPNNKVFCSEFLLSIIGAMRKRRSRVFLDFSCLPVTLALLFTADAVSFPPHFALFCLTSKLTCLLGVGYD